MHRRRIPGSATSTRAFAAAACLMLTLGACSSDAGSSAPDTSSTSIDATVTTGPPADLDATTTTTIGPAKLGIRTTSLGDILVDGDGMTLYAQAAGIAGGCTATCPEAWPPLRATTVTVGAGLDSSLFTIVDPNATPTTTTSIEGLDDGSLADPNTPATDPATIEPTTTVPAPAEGVVAVGGRVLYRFVGDVAPGETTGQGFNALFYVVLADGTLVRPPPSTTTTTNP